MTGKRWMLAGVAVILLVGSGCVCYGNKSYAVAHEIGAECAIPTCQRNQVYLFAIGGMNPAGMLALGSFREELTRQGFAKVATGQSIHAWWMARQMREIRAQEPDAVFVILGSEGGSQAAVTLAERASANGLPVAALVVLDASSKAFVPDASIHTVLLETGSGESVAAVAQLLREVALTTTPQAVEHVNGWWYPDAPPARPFVEPGPDAKWAFLFDQPGDIPLAISDVPAAAAAKSKPPVYTSALR